MDSQRNDSPFMEFEESTKTIDECINVLFEDPKLRYFFEISVPAANARKEAMGHILLICPDAETKECFITLLKSLKSNSNIRATTLKPELRPGDLGAMFTSLRPDDILLVENEKLSVDQECVEIIKKAMSNYYLELMIGKGVSAHSVRLDLSRFTAVVCVEKSSKVLLSLLHQFEYVIKIDEESLPKLCKAKIKSECPMQITEESCEYISYKAKYDIRNSINYLNRVLEYLKHKNIQTTITKDLVEEIFDLSGTGITLEEPVDDDEIYMIFNEIKNTLKEMQSDINTIRNDLRSFVECNDMI